MDGYGRQEMEWPPRQVRGSLSTLRAKWALSWLTPRRCLLVMGNRPLHVAQHPMTSKFRMNKGPGATSGCADC